MAFRADARASDPDRHHPFVHDRFAADELGSVVPTTEEMTMTTTHRTASVDGLNVFYREAGDPKAPTMLLLHGFPTSRAPSTRSRAASCWTMYLSA
jgi:hypothetical protein